MGSTELKYQATGWKTEEPWFHSRQEQEIFLFPRVRTVGTCGAFPAGTAAVALSSPLTSI
jgi:hypothetical protein